MELKKISGFFAFHNTYIVRWTQMYFFVFEKKYYAKNRNVILAEANNGTVLQRAL